MAEQAGRRAFLGQGIMAGLTAGALFAAAQTLAAGSTGRLGWAAPWRRFASVVLGQSAMTHKMTLGILLVGMVVHFILSGVFGLGIAAASRALPLGLRSNWGAHAVICAALGVVLWAINYQVIARVGYPWFLTGTHQGIQVPLHAFAFGLPVGVYLTSVVRREMGVRHRSETARRG